MKNIKNTYGFSIIELMMVLLIFGVVMAGLYAASRVQMREGAKEYRLASSELELGIGKNVMERDMSMAGYGLMDDYDYDGDGDQDFTPRGVAITNSTGVADANPDINPDVLTLMGTAIGLDSRAAQGWAPVTEIAGGIPTFYTFDDAREDVKPGDVVIIMNSNTKNLIAEDSNWLFVYQGADLKPKRADDNEDFNLSFEGMVVYGLNRAGGISQPYYIVRYYLDGTDDTRPKLCARDTQYLMREETIGAAPHSIAPVMNCVLDFQVTLGLDTDPTPNGSVDLWDKPGGTAGTYAVKDLNTRLKQIRAYFLVQVGSRDEDFTYYNPDPAYASMPDKIRVGDLSLLGGATGRDIQLTAEQRKYRWKVVSVAISPKNLR